jgi:ferredoxin
MDELAKKLGDLKGLYDKLSKTQVVESITLEYNKVLAEIEPKLHLHKVLPNVKVTNVETSLLQVNKLIEEIRTKLYLSPRAMPRDVRILPSYEWYDYMLIHMIKSSLQNIARRPTPVPPHFDFEAHNAFIQVDMPKYTDILKSEDVVLSTDDLITMLTDIDSMRVKFVKEPFRNKLMRCKNIAKRYGTRLFKDARMGDIICSRIDNLVVTEDDVQEILNHYEYMMNCEAIRIEDRDIEVIKAAMKHCPTRPFFEDLCNVLYIPEEYREVLFKNLLNQVDPPKLEKLEVSSQHRHLFL